MNIYWIQQFWFNDHYNPNSDVERHFLDIKDFGTRNLGITCALNVLGPGAHIEIHDSTISGDVRFAAVGIKSYEYIDAQGQFQHVDNDYFWPCSIIRNCVAVRLELALSRAVGRRDWDGPLFHRLGKRDMEAGITAGPESSGSHEVIHYVYDKRNGRIIASYQLLGAASSGRERAKTVLRESAETAGIPSKYVDVLELSPGDALPSPAGPIQQRVDLASRKLVLRESAGIRHVRA